MNIKCWILCMCLVPYAAADLDAISSDTLPSIEKHSVISNIDKLNTLFKALNSSKSVDGPIKKKDLIVRRNRNSKLLSKAIKNLYQLDAPHDFLPINEEGKYGQHYSLQHYIDGIAVHNEIITVVLNNNNGITTMFGDSNISSISTYHSMPISVKESPELIKLWLKTNANSPFFNIPYLSFNSINHVFYQHQERGLVEVFEVDLFLIDSENKPKRLQLFVDPISKEIFEENNILRFSHSEKFNALENRAPLSSKRLNSWGGNFRSGKRIYSKNTVYAPRVTDCKFETFSSDNLGVRKRHVITVNMENSMVMNNWTPYKLSTLDCENTTDFYEVDQFFNTLAFSPLVDAHLHAEIVTDMYKELLNETLLGQCTGDSSNHENCKEYYSRLGGRTHDVPIYQGVHYGRNFLGAFWSGRAAYYGDGGFGLLPNVSLDVVAHELTHGYHDIISSDVYLGALEEAISDIAGEAAKEYLNKKNPAYFSLFTYSDNYKYLFGREMLETASALRELLNPGLTIIPKTAPGIGVHDLSGPISLAFSRLVRDAKLNSFADAFKILAKTKKVCANPTLTGYAGLQIIADCLIAQAKGLGVHPNIEENLRIALNNIGLDLDCPPKTLCDVLKKGILDKKRGNSFIFYLAENTLNLAMNWRVSDGVNDYLSTNQEIAISNVQMNQLANRYNVSVKIGGQGGTSIEKDFQKTPSYCIPSVTKSDSYIKKLVVSSTSFISGNDGYRFDENRAVDVISGNLLSVIITVNRTVNTDRYYYFEIWIDTNNNTKFGIGEKLLSGLIPNDGKDHKYYISPGLLPIGEKIRMRTILNETAISGPCENVGKGEIEDVALFVN